jgi:hypothetical protein
MNTLGSRVSMLLVCSMLAATAPAGAAEPVTASPASSCAVKTRSDHVVIMVCPPGMNRDDWQSAGKSACEADKRCNVWIWDDAGKAPDAAPATDDVLPKKLTAVAVAVWVNDSRNLIILSRARE